VAIPGAQFEYAMDRIRAKVEGTEPAIQSLEKRILELGASTTLSAREVAAAAEEMAAMGFTATEIADALPGVIAAAEATGEDLGIVMETVAEALNNFGYEASEASRVADVLAEAANASAANIETMHYVMKYAAPSAKQLGMEIEDLAAAAMILADRGLEASQIGRYLRMGLSRLAAPTKQAKALMRDLGIEVFNAEGKLKPFPEVIRELKTAFDDLTPAQAQAAAKTIFGTEAMTAFLMLIDEGPDKLERYIKQLENAAGAADRMAKVLKDNLLMDLEQLGGELETLAINIFGENVGWMRAGVQAATNFFEGINKAFSGKQKPAGVPLGKADVLIGEGTQGRYLQGYRESWMTTIIRGIFGEGSVATQIAAAIERDDWYSVGLALGNGLRKAVESVDYGALAQSIVENLGRELASVGDNLEPFLEGFFQGIGFSEDWAKGIADVITDALNPIRLISEEIERINKASLPEIVASLETFRFLLTGQINPSLVEAVLSFDNMLSKLAGIAAAISFAGSMIKDLISGNITGAIEKAEALEAVLKKKVPPEKLAPLLKNMEYLIDQGWEWHSILEAPTTKTVTVAYRTPGGKAIKNPYLGGYVHSGGIVPRTAHSGMVVPGAGTVPTRLWGGEMVITRGQQAKLMHMLRYGFAGNGPSGQGGGGTTYNITVNARTADIDEREMMRVLRRMEMLA